MTSTSAFLCETCGKSFTRKDSLMRHQSGCKLTPQKNEFVVVEETQWCNTMVVETMSKLQQGRSVLIICETIKDVNSLNYTFKEVVKNVDKLVIKNIRVVREEEDVVNARKTRVCCSEIIIATNLAGRGTDFKTTKSLQANGGIHVLVGFLPCNSRVQRQAFGRTARMGEKGSASMIIRDIETNKDPNKDYKKFDDILTERDILEEQRLDTVTDRQLSEIIFKDKLFDKFAELYSTKKKKYLAEIGSQYLLRDLKEDWAFWLEIRTENTYKTITKFEDLKITEEFQLFEEQIVFLPASDLNTIRTKNPYYDILRAEELMETTDSKTAKVIIEDMTKKSHDLELMASFHMCKFELEYEGIDKSLIKTIIDGLAELITIELPDCLKNPTNNKAIDSLEKAKKCLNNELDQIDAMRDDEVFQKYVLETACPDNQSDVKINELMEHIRLRYQCLSVFKTNAKIMIEQLTKDSSLQIQSKVVRALSNKEIKEQFKINDDISHELDEIFEVGLHAFINLHKPGLPMAKLVGGVLCVGIGAGIMAIGFALPFLSFLTFPVGLTLIEGGFTDYLVAWIFPTSATQVDTGAYVLDKLKSVAISALLAFIGLGLAKLGGQIFTTVFKVVKLAGQAAGKVNEAVTIFNKMFPGILPDDINKISEVLGKFSDVVDKISQKKGKSPDEQIEALQDLPKKLKGNVESFDLGEAKEANKKAIGDQIKRFANVGLKLFVSKSLPESVIDDVITEFCEFNRDIKLLVRDIFQVYRNQTRIIDVRSKKFPKGLETAITRQLGNAMTPLLAKLQNSESIIKFQNKPVTDFINLDNDTIAQKLSDEIMRNVNQLVINLYIPQKREKKHSIFSSVTYYKNLIVDVIDDYESKSANSTEIRTIREADKTILKKAFQMTRYFFYVDCRNKTEESLLSKLSEDILGSTQPVTPCLC